MAHTQLMMKHAWPGYLLICIAFVFLLLALNHWPVSIQDDNEPLVLTVPNDPVNPINEGKWLHVTGVLQGNRPLVDSDFRFPIAALSLRRTVEMYQWQEATSEQGELQYNAMWSEKLIPSLSFVKKNQYQNPRSMAYGTRRYQVEQVNLGKFAVDASFLDLLEEQLYDVGNIDIAQLPLPSVMKQVLKPYNNYLYLGQDPNQPRIGDIRFQFFVKAAQTVTLIGQQKGNVLAQTTPLPDGFTQSLKFGRVSLTQWTGSQEISPKQPAWYFMVFSLASGLLLLLALYQIRFRPWGRVVDLSVPSESSELSEPVSATSVLSSTGSLPAASESTTPSKPITDKESMSKPAATTTLMQPSANNTQAPLNPPKASDLANSVDTNSAQSVPTTVRYRIAFKGEIHPDQSVEAVKARFAQLFKKDEKIINGLFSGKVVILKTHLELEQAKKIQKLLSKQGARVYIIKMPVKT